MRFHQVPLSYNWHNMPSHTATFDTQNLIYDVSQAADVDYSPDGSSICTGITVDGKNYSVIDTDKEGNTILLVTLD